MTANEQACDLSGMMLPAYDHCWYNHQVCTARMQNDDAEPVKVSQSQN